MKKTFLLKLLILLSMEFIFNGSTEAQYKSDYTALFDGYTSYVAVPNSADLNPSSAITLEAWIKPSQLTVSTQAVFGKNYQTSYFLGVQSSGQIVFYPKAGTSFRSRMSNPVKTNQWTHIAATYDGAIARIYINGLLDTTTNVTGPIGTNTDSLFIGADRIGTNTELFFKGQIDNARIWNLARTGAQIADNRFIPLEIYFPSGFSSGLAASFQFDSDAGSMSGVSFISGYPRNVTFINNINKGNNHQDYNNSLVLNGVTDFFKVNNITASGFNPTTAITLEAWIKRDTTGAQPLVMNILNKSGGATRYDYGLYIYPTGEVNFDFSNGAYYTASLPMVTNARWTHVAGTYNSATGKAVVYVNGDSVAGNYFESKPLITNVNDPVYIGGIGATNYSINRFKGQIDGVRIWGIERTAEQIKNSLYRLMDPTVDLTSFNFDKSQNIIYAGGARIYLGTTFAGNAHISSSHENVNTKSTSPILYDPAGGFYGGSYTISNNHFFIPDNNPSGISDSIFISSPGIISNLKVFLLMNHTYTGDVNIKLISPSGTVRTLFNNAGGTGNDIMTIFTDVADSSAATGTSLQQGLTAPFSPKVKPSQPLSSFNGEEKAGWWKLKIIDNADTDIGYVNSWGLNITGTPLKTLKMTCLLQGFYDPVTNNMIKDTATVLLRSSLPGHEILDSARAVLDSTGKGIFKFSSITSTEVFHIVVKHRNSITSWSAGGYRFTTDSMNYNFTIAKNEVYGGNQILVDSSPEKYAFFGGDVNGDGFVNLSDIIIASNDAASFTTGYNRSDVNGDNVTDLKDLVITYNNSAAFVKSITP